MTRVAVVYNDDAGMAQSGAGKAQGDACSHDQAQHHQRGTGRAHRHRSDDRYAMIEGQPRSDVIAAEGDGNQHQQHRGYPSRNGGLARGR